MSTEIVKHESSVQRINFLDPAQFATAQRAAKLFASSELVPEMYRITSNNPEAKAIANCLIALETASRIGASPLMVMQNMYIVYGQPAWSAKFLTATVNGCGRYNSIKYKMRVNGQVTFQGKTMDNWECIAYTSEKGSDEVLESIPVDLKMAVDEGWYGKKGSKWQTMPKLMLQYRAVTFWTRAYAPELSMGIRPADEIEDYVEYEEVTEKVAEEIKEKANTQEMKIDVPAAEPANREKPEPVKVVAKETVQAEMSGAGF